MFGNMTRSHSGKSGDYIVCYNIGMSLLTISHFIKGGKVHYLDAECTYIFLTYVFMQTFQTLKAGCLVVCLDLVSMKKFVVHKSFDVIKSEKHGFDL